MKKMKLQEWVTIKAASEYLSRKLDENCCDEDVLQFALQGKLRLSVNFVNREPVRSCNYKKDVGHDSSGFVTRKFTNNQKWLDIVLDPPNYVEGVFNLSMLGSERDTLGQQMQMLIIGYAGKVNREIGAILERDGELYELCDPNTVDHDPRRITAGHLRRDHQLVIRADYLQDFTRSLSNLTNERNEENIHPKEKDSLLKIIIGMAKVAYGYDQNEKRSPIPREIVEAVESQGLSIDPDTVRKWLKEGAELLDQTPTD